MIRYSKTQKEVFSSSYMELANFAFASLIFGQFLTKKSDMPLTLFGIAFYVFFHALSYFITSKE